MIFHPAATFLIGVQVAHAGVTFGTWWAACLHVVPATICILPVSLHSNFSSGMAYITFGGRLMLLLKQSILIDYPFGIGRPIK